jgi:putative ABC transport system ATP-binding protein
VVAAVLASAGRISLGELVAAVGLAQLVLAPMGSLAGLGSGLARCRASAARVAAALAGAAADDRSAPAGWTPRGALRLDHLSVGELRDLDLDVPPGQLLGVVATRPAVARQLVDCLAGRRPPDGGAILVDGRPLAELPDDLARAVVLVADHDAVLFEGTIAENLGPVDDEVLAASAADEVVASVEGGLAADVGEAGGSLSGGQRQRVALARALVRDAAVLVLHDPTTAVDPATEARIAEGLRALRRGRTTLVIATSPALLAECDRVVVLDDTVVAEGRHADLADRADYRASVLS